MLNLDLSHNQLTALPVEIGQLPKLQNLYLSQNQLASLPVEAVEELKHHIKKSRFSQIRQRKESILFF
ncbi:leucine-rich repeat domain-containing protein [Neochlamydia sp. EPS4]|uniref:leucine-rich repeat domain-containing protein n=1 Tax=Neochlamydia sp. EPS4 TaxID=1478175 RepID=UPI0034CE2F88